MFLCNRAEEHRGNTMSLVIHKEKEHGFMCMTDHINESYSELCSGVQNGTIWGAFVK